MRAIDGYRILGLLGQGGMSRVLKVRSPRDGRLLALKLLAPHPHLVELLGMEEIRKRFRFEADVLAGIDHPHVVRLEGASLAGEHWYVLLEYHCRSVSEWIGEGPRVEESTRPVRPDLALNVARQTALALQALHERGLVHRDVKPANLLLDVRKSVKLTDFGLSKLRGERWNRPPQLMVGSPFYAAPEQERDPEGVDERADLYSLGVVFFRLVTGRLPDEVLDQGSDQGPSRVAFREEFETAGETFLRRTLAEKPAKRFARAGEVLAVLNELEAFWRTHRKAVCRDRLSGRGSADAVRVLPGDLRSTPIKMSGKEAGRTLPVDGLWKPRRKLPVKLVPEAEIIRDLATGLIWQRAGSRRTLVWHEAHAYVAELNEEQWAGLTAWRLPTVEELLSLLDPEAPLDDFCLEPLFHRRQSRLWSADRRSYLSAWIVDVQSGYLGWQDHTCPAYVRAVANASPR